MLEQSNFYVFTKREKWSLLVKSQQIGIIVECKQIPSASMRSFLKCQMLSDASHLTPASRYQLGPAFSPAESLLWKFLVMRGFIWRSFSGDLISVCLSGVLLEAKDIYWVHLQSLILRPTINLEIILNVRFTNCQSFIFLSSQEWYIRW